MDKRIECTGVHFLWCPASKVPKAMGEDEVTTTPLVVVYPSRGPAMAMASICQELKGGGITLGGVEFDGKDACIAFAWEHLTGDFTYHCIPSFLYVSTIISWVWKSYPLEPPWRGC